ncbi:anti-repressor SinI family protein [Neobacillus sp. NPDC058068]
MINRKAGLEEIDQEWLQLILDAKNIGMVKEEIREFLIQNGVKDILMDSH